MTVATCSSLVLQLIDLLVALPGYTVAIKVTGVLGYKLNNTDSSAAVFKESIPVTFIILTHVIVLLLNTVELSADVAIILHSPPPTAVTKPFESTVAISVLSDDHIISVLDALAGIISANICTGVFPYTVIDDRPDST